MFITSSFPSPKVFWKWNMPLLWFMVLLANLVVEIILQTPKIHADVYRCPQQKSSVAFGPSCHDSTDVGCHFVELLKYSYPPLRVILLKLRKTYWKGEFTYHIYHSKENKICKLRKCWEYSIFYKYVGQVEKFSEPKSPFSGLKQKRQMLLLQHVKYIEHVKNNLTCYYSILFEILILSSVV